MFTGIIQSIGRIQAIEHYEGGAFVELACVNLINDLAIGDSLAVNGVCSTIKNKRESIVSIDYLSETLAKTTIGNLAVGDSVNLELAMQMNTRMGGHMIQGHVDCVGEIIDLGIAKPWSSVTVSYPEKFKHLLVEKGSISLDGISLTVVDVQNTQFTCHLIEHTVENTVFSKRQKGDKVNLEFDIVGKYLYRFYSQIKD